MTREEIRKRRAREKRARIAIAVLPALVFVVALILGATESKATPPSEREEQLNLEHVGDFGEDILIIPLSYKELQGREPDALPIHFLEDTEKGEEELLESGYLNDAVPLSYEEQELLRLACRETGVPYSLALAVIEKETQFNNIKGDDGASLGFMQVQQKWHQDRMNRLGVTDLMEPGENFLVGCDFLAELLRKYDSVEMAVTAYNMGHDPGYITNYARDVMEYYERWQEVIDDDLH